MWNACVHVHGLQVGRPNDVKNPKEKVGRRAAPNHTSVAADTITTHLTHTRIVRAGPWLQERQRKEGSGKSGEWVGAREAAVAGAHHSQHRHTDRLRMCVDSHFAFPSLLQWAEYKEFGDVHFMFARDTYMDLPTKTLEVAPCRLLWCMVM